VIGDLTGDLAFSQLECGAFLGRYPGAARLGNRLTREEFLSKAGNAAICHITTHMSAVPGHPLEAAVLLAGTRDAGIVVNLREIYTGLQLSGTALTILNGCASGVLQDWGSKNPEGLPTGFFSAGSGSVVSTLWPVDDLPSALLLDRFHAEMAPGVTISQGLCRAVNWLRGCPGVDGALTDVTAAKAAVADLIRRAQQGIAGHGEIPVPVLQHCEDCMDKLSSLYPQTPPFSGPAHWAAHIVQGAGALPLFIA
jgi:CHAT domain-containing protein